jgi:hypothetical protein
MTNAPATGGSVLADYQNQQANLLRARRRGPGEVLPTMALSFGGATSTPESGSYWNQVKGGLGVGKWLQDIVERDRALTQQSGGSLTDVLGRAFNSVGAGLGNAATDIASLAGGGPGGYKERSKDDNAWASTYVSSPEEKAAVRQAAYDLRLKGIAINEAIRGGRRDVLPGYLTTWEAQRFPFHKAAGLRPDQWLNQMGYEEYEPMKWRRLDPIGVGGQQVPGPGPGLTDYGGYNWRGGGDYGGGGGWDYGGGGGWDYGGGGGGRGYASRGNLGLVNWKIGIG